MTEAPDNIRCTARLAGDGLQCSLEYDHRHGHAYVSGSYLNDRRGDES